LDCKDADKTRVFIERSKSLPLDVSLRKSKHASYCDDALLAAALQINRLDCLAIRTSAKTLSNLLKHFPYPAPLLKELKIILNPDSFGPAIPSTISPNSPLRKLSLSGVVTDLPWRNLSNLTVFEFRHILETVDPLFMVQLLDFFESAPLLNEITLHDSIPTSSSVPPGRVVPLLNLEKLTIHGLPVHSTFLDHLPIPRGASLDLCLVFPLDSDIIPIPVCLANDFNNLHHITTINLFIEVPWIRARLKGPSGGLRIFGIWGDWDTSPRDSERQFFRPSASSTFQKPKGWRLRRTPLHQESKLKTLSFSKPSSS